MAMDYSLKGKEYERISFTVERGHVLAFCDAIGEPAAIYRDPEAARGLGHDGQLAPPTFLAAMQLQTSGQAVLDPALGLNYAMVVHGEQEYEWHRPVRVGDVLSAVPRIADVYAKGPNEFLVIETDVRDADGEPVAIVRSTLLSRGTAERGQE